MRLLKKIYVHMRNTVKLLSLVTLGIIIIAAAIVLIYKPIYKVTVDGEKIGYCKDKTALQNKINAYMEKGEEGEKYVAFVQIDDLPEYSMCLLKKGIVTNDDEIYETIKKTGTTYYRYYAVAEDGNEKYYVATFNEADEAIKKLKDKKSSNASKLTIVEKYEAQIPELAEEKEVVAKLYKEKKSNSNKSDNSSKSKNSTTIKYASTGSGKFSTSRELHNSKVSLGISLSKPVSGVLTSRYGYRWGRTHTGIDIGVPMGTPVKAAASGTVTFAGWKGALGNLVVISHGNGVQTYYGHNSRLVVKAGQKISQGEVVAKAGSTGQSTGPHVHFEVRVNGSSYNPLGYVSY